MKNRIPWPIGFSVVLKMNKKEWKKLEELYIVFFHGTPFFFNSIKEWADYENEWERIYDIEHLSLLGKKNLEIRLNGYKIEIYTYEEKERK